MVFTEPTVATGSYVLTTDDGRSGEGSSERCEGRNVMTEKPNYWAVIALICSILSLVLMPYLLFLFFHGKRAGIEVNINITGFLIFPLTFPVLMIISIVLGIIALRKREARGKRLAAVTIVVGILEILACSFGFWFLLQMGSW